MTKPSDKHAGLSAAQEAEIQELREARNTTRRATVGALEEVLYEPLPVLDHGFVRVIDYMGDDSAIVQAARVSYGKGTKHTRGDAGLIGYLMRHRHTTPFEMCEIKFHVKLPIFVARQWIRHRTANVNEYSARYSVLDKEFYIPAPEHLAAQSTANRQGRGGVLEGEEAARVLDLLRQDAELCYEHYEEMLNEREDGSTVREGRAGLARELARMNLPLNTYTQWYWKCDLHNLLHFVALRADPHAQYEIRVYADAILKVLHLWVPIATAAFVNQVMDGASLSGPALRVVRQMIAGQAPTQEESGMSKREWEELMQALGRDT
jgi:thymidylate synthase (FAD)